MFTGTVRGKQRAEGQGTNAAKTHVLKCHLNLQSTRTTALNPWAILCRDSAGCFCQTLTSNSIPPHEAGYALVAAV